MGVPLARRPESKSPRRGVVIILLCMPHAKNPPRSFDWLLRKDNNQFSPLGGSLSDLNFHQGPHGLRRQGHPNDDKATIRLPRPIQVRGWGRPHH